MLQKLHCIHCRISSGGETLNPIMTFTFLPYMYTSTAKWIKHQLISSCCTKYKCMTQHLRLYPIRWLLTDFTTTLKCLLNTWSCSYRSCANILAPSCSLLTGGGKLAEENNKNTIRMLSEDNMDMDGWDGGKQHRVSRLECSDATAQQEGWSASVTAFCTFWDTEN